MATFQFELVSPEKLLLSRAVEMAVLPASEGEMGVLPGHAPMIVMLRGGVIAVTENGQVTERLYVAGGFAEIAPDRCTVLADEATPVAQLSKTEAESRVQEAEAAYTAAAMEAPEKRDATMTRLLAARAMVQAAASA